MLKYGTNASNGVVPAPMIYLRYLVIVPQIDCSKNTNKLHDRYKLQQFQILLVFFALAIVNINVVLIAKGFETSFSFVKQFFGNMRVALKNVNSISKIFTFSKL